MQRVITEVGAWSEVEDWITEDEDGKIQSLGCQMGFPYSSLKPPRVLSRRLIDGRNQERSGHICFPEHGSEFSKGFMNFFIPLNGLTLPSDVVHIPLLKDLRIFSPCF